QFLDEGPGRMRVVSFEEEIAYLSQASQPLKDIAQIILDTGLRPEEVFRIRVEHVDCASRTIFNPLGKTPAARRKIYFESPQKQLHLLGPRIVTGQVAVWQVQQSAAVEFAENIPSECIFAIFGAKPVRLSLVLVLENAIPQEAPAIWQE